jgi:Fe-S cluster biogenesis protein NfuA
MTSADTLTHPERTPDPRTVRWRVRDHPLPADPLPAALQALIDDGIADSVTPRPGQILVSLTHGRHWSEQGPRVRDAVVAALRECDPSPGNGPGAHEVAAVSTEIIDDLIAPVAAAHAGAVDLVSVAPDAVRVRLSGACRGCPLSGLSVRGRLEGELRRRLPGQDIRVVTVSGESPIAPVRRLIRGCRRVLRRLPPGR